MTVGQAVLRGLAIAVPAAIGVAAIYFAGSFQRLPESGTAARQPTPVRVITLAPIEIVPRVTGYGTVAPVREWRAVARVEGEIVARAEGLAPGDLVAGGTALFRIDDTDLRLDLAGIEAQLAASVLKDQTLQASLDLAQGDLDLARQDLARQAQLNAQGVVTQAALDTSRRQELSARAKVSELQSAIALNAAEREVLVTQKASVERSIGLAQVPAPYDLRVTELSADLGQYVSRGQVMLSGEGIEAVDIAAQFPIGRIGPLLRQAGAGTEVTDLKARVRLPAADHEVVWPARVERMGEAIDERTQSSAVVVRVTDPQSQSAAGSRPPLRRNMFVEVELSAPRAEALVLPAEAVQDGAVLVVSPAGTLERRKIETGFALQDLVVVTGGLAAGDQVVVTDPTIAVPGMEVKAVEDEARKAAIAALAAGSAPGAGAKPAAAQGAGQGAGQGSGQGGGAGKAKEASE